MNQSKIDSNPVVGKRWSKYDSDKPSVSYVYSNANKIVNFNPKDKEAPSFFSSFISECVKEVFPERKFAQFKAKEEKIENLKKKKSKLLRIFKL